jgi:ankyrin repeat protein
MLSLTYSETALQFAAQSGNTEACRVLLESRADVSRADKIFGNTALHEGIVALWVQQGGCEVNTSNKYLDMEAELSREDTALHIAAAQGHLDIYMLLLLID